MAYTEALRFAFIGHALRGDGPFRPANIGPGEVTTTGQSYIDRYARESDLKYERRNAVAWYSHPMSRACSRFVGHLTTKRVQREIGQDIYIKMSENIDGKENSLDVFWQQYAVEFKARGSMLLLVDMPSNTGMTRSDQLAGRRIPYWTPILPETVRDYQLGDDGKFDFVQFAGRFKKEDGEIVDCIWHFDREKWEARQDDKDQAILDGNAHPLKECPVLISVENGDFPSFGPFAAIADMSKRLFNLNSELDEIMRAQTFSVLMMQVPDGTTNAEKLVAAKTAGETIGTSNLVIHTGTTPAFVAPPDGPARVYMDRINALMAEIDEIGLNVASVNQQESGLAMQHRFQAINAELAKFAMRLEDLERRAWDLSMRWLGFSKMPTIQWPRDFNIADVEQEMRILVDMQAGNMPARVVAEQQKRIVGIQFGGLEQGQRDEIDQAIDERSLERPAVVDAGAMSQ
jgi:hypothetical protein